MSLRVALSAVAVNADIIEFGHTARLLQSPLLQSRAVLGMGHVLQGAYRHHLQHQTSRDGCSPAVYENTHV